jgi:hypothetical protein
MDHPDHLNSKSQIFMHLSLYHNLVVHLRVFVDKVFMKKQCPHSTH